MIDQMTGTLSVVNPGSGVSDDRPQRNKALVLEAMTSLFQRHDVSAVEPLYTRNYIQHNPNIPQGRDALAALVAGLSQDVYYEPVSWSLNAISSPSTAASAAGRSRRRS